MKDDNFAQNFVRTT